MLSAARGFAVSCPKNGHIADNIFNAEPHWLIVRNFSKMAVGGLSVSTVGFRLFLGFPNISQEQERLHFRGSQLVPFIQQRNLLNSLAALGISLRLLRKPG